MKRSLLIMSLLLLSAWNTAIAQVDPIEGSTTGFAGYPYRLFSPDSADEDATFPLILFLHGSFERGTDNEKHVQSHIQPLIDSCLGSEYPAFLVAPQSEFYWDPIVLRQLVEVLLQELPIDPWRVYVTGISVGGRATWDTAFRGLDIFSAGIPLSARSKPEAAQLLGAAGIPLWAFHGDADPIVPLNNTLSMISAIESAGGKPRLTQLPGFGHNDWSPIYDDDPDFTGSWTGGEETDSSASLYAWLFDKQLSETPYSYPQLKEDEEILFDFGNNHQAPNGTIWNNISVDPTTSLEVLTSVITSDGDSRSVGLQITDAFEGTENNGNTSGGTYPTAVSNDYWWTGSQEGHEEALTQPAKIVLTNLPLDQTFRLRFFVSSLGMDGGLDQLTRFSANGNHVELEATDNQDQFVSLYRTVANEDGTLEITVSPSPQGNGRFAYLNAMELWVEPWPITFAFWGEINGVDPDQPTSDQDGNGIPDLMDFLYGNLPGASSREAVFTLSENALTVRFPIREEPAASGLFHLEQSSDLQGEWQSLGTYDFSTQTATGLTPSGTASDPWLLAEDLPVEVGSFYRLRGEIP